MKTNFGIARQRQSELILFSVLCQFVFLNAISGIRLSTNLLITTGLILQTGLGLGILRVLASSVPFTVLGLIASSVVMGIIPICVITLFFYNSKILMLLIAIPLALPGIVTLGGYFQRGSDSLTSDHTPFLAQRTVIILVVTNLVFARFQQSSIVLIGLIGSVLLLFTSNQQRGLRIYLLVIGLVVALMSIFGSSGTVYTLFKTSHDQFFERVWGLSIISTKSLENPFLADSNIHYHFLSYVYFTSFEELTNVADNHFSPAYLAVCLVALLALLLENVEQVLTRNSAMSLALVLLGSWPFWESFPLDDGSRSQSLSLAFVALCLTLLPRISTASSSLLYGGLVGWTFLTKTTSGAFLLIVSLMFLLLTCGKKLSIGWSLRGLISDLQNKKYIFITTLLSFCAVGSSYLLVFTSLNGPTPEMSRTSIGFIFPKVYWGLNTQRHPLILTLILVVAICPTILFLIIGLKRFTSSVVRQRVVSPLTDLHISVLVGSVLLSGLGLVFVGAKNLNHYFVSVAAIFGGTSAYSFIQVPVIHRSTSRLLLLVCSFSMAFIFLRMKQEAYLKSYFSEFKLVLIISVLFLIVFILNYLLDINWVSCLFWAVALLCFANSVGSSWDDRRFTGYDLYSSPDKIEMEIDSLKDVIKYFDSIDTRSVVAIDLDIRNSDIPTLLAASTPIQYWAGRYREENTTEFGRRVAFQQTLTMSPSVEVLSKARDESVTHVLLANVAAKLVWSQIQVDRNTEPRLTSMPMRVVTSNGYVVYRLGTGILTK